MWSRIYRLGGFAEPITSGAEGFIEEWRTLRAAADPRFQERALERRRRPWRRALWVLGSLLVVGSLVWLAFWSPVLAVRSVAARPGLTVGLDALLDL